MDGRHSSHSLQHERNRGGFASKYDKDNSHGNDTNNNDTGTVLDYRHSFYMATLGGARALDLDDRIGTYNVGMWSGMH